MSIARPLPSLRVKHIRVHWLCAWSCGEPDRLGPCSHDDDHQVGCLVPARLVAIDSRAMVTSTRHASPPLHMRESRAVRVLKDRVHPVASRVPRVRARRIPRFTRKSRVRAKRRFEEEIALRPRHRHVGVAGV